MGSFNNFLWKVQMGKPEQSKYAGFTERLFAFIIDFALLFIVNSILMRMLQLSDDPLTEVVWELNSLSAIVTNPVFLVSSWLYYAILESNKTFQATFGKYLLRLKVVTDQEQKISFGRATGRYFAKFFSSIVFGLGYIAIIFNKHNQGWHDMAAKTYVIYK